MKKRQGFTLAEVLITVGIIGVIAAVTLPALNSNVNKHAIERQTQKFYTQFANAISLYQADNESDLLLGLDFDKDEFVKKYFNILQKYPDSGECYADSYTYLHDNTPKTIFNIISRLDAEDEPLAFTSYMLPDGSVFSMRYNPALSEYDNTTKEKHALIWVYFDVNGKKGPNKLGVDLWNFGVFYNGKIDDDNLGPEYFEDQTKLEEQLANNLKQCEKNGKYCFGHFMRNNFKFDYDY